MLLRFITWMVQHGVPTPAWQVIVAVLRNSPHAAKQPVQWTSQPRMGSMRVYNGQTLTDQVLKVPHFINFRK